MHTAAVVTVLLYLWCLPEFIRNNQKGANGCLVILGLTVFFAGLVWFLWHDGSPLPVPLSAEDIQRHTSPLVLP